MALCFNCGEVKFGALCPCPKCRTGSTGDMGLDIQFSDHHYDVETLKEFGNVIRAIQGACNDPATRFWTFLEYVSEHHPNILSVQLKPEAKAKAAEILSGLALPPVTLRESAGHRFKAERFKADES